MRPNWKTDKDAKLGDYTVDKVEPAEDGNSKELTLKKTDNEGNTTYTLKKEETSTDENGNTPHIRRR